MLIELMNNHLLGSNFGDYRSGTRYVTTLAAGGEVAYSPGLRRIRSPPEPQDEVAPNRRGSDVLSACKEHGLRSISMPRWYLPSGEHTD